MEQARPKQVAGAPVHGFANRPDDGLAFDTNTESWINATALGLFLRGDMARFEKMRDAQKEAGRQRAYFDVVEAYRSLLARTAELVSGKRALAPPKYFDIRKELSAAIAKVAGKPLVMALDGEGSPSTQMGDA